MPSPSVAARHCSHAKSNGTAARRPYVSGRTGKSNVPGVTAIAFGTAVLLLSANCAAGTSLRPARVSAVIEALGKLSYELYLFHLIVLGLLRTIYPPSHVTGDEKLALLVGYLLLSVGLGAAIARSYAEPSNRVVRKWLTPRRANRQANAPRRIGATSNLRDLDSRERLEGAAAASASSPGFRAPLGIVYRACVR